MARYNCVIASKFFEDIRDGKMTYVVFGGAWEEFVMLSLHMTELTVGDVLDFVDDSSSEVIPAEVTSLHKMEGVTVASICLIQAEKIYEVTTLPKFSVNQLYARKHFGYRKTMKDIITTEMWKVLGQERIYFKCDIEYTFLFRNNPLDATNCFAMIKMIEDVMVVDDAPHFVRSTKAIVGLYDGKEDMKVIIKIKY